MQTVIEGFLNVENLDSGLTELQCKPVEINRLVARSIQHNAEYAKKKGVTLIEELSPELPAVVADEFRIAQVMDNLIGNAMKFSPRQTTTTVRTRTDGNFVYAEVSDGGPGLSEEDMSKLFQRHARLSNRPTGGESSSGIGLSLSKQFIDQHKGLIGARNNTSDGATFWIGLPIKPQGHN
jgi:signal transduction histidine kinase